MYIWIHFRCIVFAAYVYRYFLGTNYMLTTYYPHFSIWYQFTEFWQCIYLSVNMICSFNDLLLAQSHDNTWKHRLVWEPKILHWRKCIWKYRLQKWRPFSMDFSALTVDTLKRKCRHFDGIFITGCAVSCQNHNLRCSQWRKFRQNDDISFWVYTVFCLLISLYRWHTPLSANTLLLDVGSYFTSMN